MAWNLLVNLIVSLIVGLINYVLAPKPEFEPPPEPEGPKVPYHKEGTPIPVVFGTCDISPFVGWYDGFNNTNIYESVSKKG